MDVEVAEEACRKAGGRFSLHAKRISPSRKIPRKTRRNPR